METLNPVQSKLQICNFDQIFMSKDTILMNFWLPKLPKHWFWKVQFPILKDAYEKAKKIIMEHMDQLDDLSYAVLEYETLDGNEVKKILERSLNKTLAKDDNANSVYFFVKKEI